MEFHEILTNDLTFRYRVLDRMRCDCEYYLGYGKRHPKHLWAPTEKRHISYMKALWNCFSDEQKPEWLSFDKILDYEMQMIHEHLPITYKCRGVFQHDNLQFSEDEIKLQVMSAVKEPDYFISKIECVEEEKVIDSDDFPDDYIFTFEFLIETSGCSQTNILNVLKRVDGGELLELVEANPSIDEKIKAAQVQVKDAPASLDNEKNYDR